MSSFDSLFQDLPEYRSLAELIEDFQLLDDWEDRYAYLIDLGKQLSGLPDALKTEAHRVQGCTSQVWLVHQLVEHPNGTVINLIADSDAFIVRGLVAILLSAYSGKTQSEIRELDLNEVFGQIGLERNLSVSRRNGFAAMMSKVQSWAQV